LSTGIPTEQAGATSVDPVPSRQPLRESRMLDQDLFAERAPVLSRRLITAIVLFALLLGGFGIYRARSQSSAAPPIPPCR